MSVVWSSRSQSVPGFWTDASLSLPNSSYLKTWWPSNLDLSDILIVHIAIKRSLIMFKFQIWRKQESTVIGKWWQTKYKCISLYLINRYVHLIIGKLKLMLYMYQIFILFYYINIPGTSTCT